MSNTTDKLCDFLHTEQLDRLLFRGFTPPATELPKVFGGQVLAQALNAAIRTVDLERQMHSMHAYFLRPGDITKPIIYEVDPIRDGGTFTTRRVVAKQNGKAIFNTSLSFHIPEQGLEHQIDMPAVPTHSSLVTDDLRTAQFLQDNPERQHPPRADSLRAFELRTHGEIPFLSEDCHPQSRASG